MGSARSASGALVVERLSKRFDSVCALTDVSCEVVPQQILGIIGPNGAGKTTLLECIAGLLPTDAGRVLWHGSPLPTQRRKTVLFYLPEGIVPYPQQTVRQVVAFFRDVFAVERGRTRYLTEFLGLLPQGDRPLGQLSKGGRRRLLLCLSLLAPHPLLLIDEPFDGLDLRQSLEMMQLLGDEKARGRTLVLSIHQLSEAQRICERFVLLTGGRVAGQGTLAELLGTARLESGSLEDIFLALS